MFIYPISFKKLSSKLVFLDWKCFFAAPKKSVNSGHKPALVPDKWIFFGKVSIS